MAESGFACIELCAEYLNVPCGEESCTQPTIMTFYVQLPGQEAWSARGCRGHWRKLRDDLVARDVTLRYSARARRFIEDAGQ
jgi:hypothetical protein